MTQSVATASQPARWEHFPHQADVGVRGIGPTKAAAFENAALALTAIAVDPATVRRDTAIAISCAAPGDALLLVDWLNAVIFEMATRAMVFGAYCVTFGDGSLTATAWGEILDRARHAPAAEPKGATYTALSVTRNEAGAWVAQCVVDV